MSATKTTKSPKAAATKTTPTATAKKMSALDAAAQVLAEAGEPMNAKAMIGAMASQGYWTSPGGKTPHATLYAAILREIGVKGDASRFRRTTKGLFSATASREEPAAPPLQPVEVVTPKTKLSKAIPKPAKAPKAPAEPAGEIAYEPLPA